MLFTGPVLGFEWLSLVSDVSAFVNQSIFTGPSIVAYN
jgi:hypothetical protein